MKERPILFSGPMVRAILEGRKTMTRRVINHLGNAWHIDRLLGEWSLSEAPRQYTEGDRLWRWAGKTRPQPGDWIWCLQTEVDDTITFPITSPFGTPGDRLWVRETWAPCFTDGSECKHCTSRALTTCYRATHNGPEPRRWKPSIYMPRWASRITLEITSVRVERLQEITEEDAMMEGTHPDGTSSMGHVFTAREHFEALWNLINGKKYPWESNPWVWVISFQPVSNLSQKTGGAK